MRRWHSRVGVYNLDRLVGILMAKWDLVKAVTQKQMRICKKSDTFSVLLELKLLCYWKNNLALLSLHWNLLKLHIIEKIIEFYLVYIETC